MPKSIKFYLDEMAPKAVAKGQEHAGIVYIPQQRRVSLGNLINSLCLVHDVLTPEDMINRIEYM